MHKKISKAIVGSLMSAAMLASSAAAVIPMSASAGSLLGQSDFNEGVGLPWHTCESQPAKQSFTLEDGQYVVKLIEVDGPESRWDLQFRHRNIKITSGNKYHIEFDIWASEDGELATHIADLKGENPVWLSGCEGTKAWNYSGQTDDNGYEHTKNSSNLVIKKGKNHFEGDFTADKTIEVAEWAFHYGGQGEWQDNDCFPNGTILKFDNMILENVSSDADDFDTTNEFGCVRPRSNVRINQVGYYPNLEKTATYCTDNSSPCEFELRDSSGKAVYTGKASKVVVDEDAGNGENDKVTIGGKSYTRKKDSGKYCQILDFSDFDKSGKYTIFVKDSVGVSNTIAGLTEGFYDTKASGDKLVWTNPRTKIEYVMNESAEFRIDENIYDDGLVRNSINYFYNNRSGVDIEAKYITGTDSPEDLAHEGGHKEDKAAVVESWTKFYDGDFSDADSSYSITATGGWYDAGDHGKYVVNGGISVWQLQNTYELSKCLGTDDKWTGDLVKIPESGDANPDILDEARYELEWMMEMIVSSKDPKWGKYEGFVYHKLHDHKWTGLATKAWSYEEEWGTKRLVKPPTYAATFNFIACAAQASRLWEPYDSAFAKKCLELAETSYNAIMKFESDWSIKAGTYSKRNTTSEKVCSGDPLFAPDDQAIGGGPYGDNYVEDDAYWAACELFATTGESKYYDYLSKYQNKNIDGDKAFTLTSSLAGGENKGSMSSFNWGCTAGLGTLSLYLNTNGYVSADDHKKVSESIVAAGDVYLTRMHDDTNGMGIPYQGSEFTDPNNIGNDDDGNPIVVSGYEWGSNSFVINNAIVLAYAYQASGDKTYLNGTAEAMDYILGRNGNGFSYVSGYGNYTLTNPHHRFWCGGIDPEFPMCPAGVLSGGPGAGMQDPYVGGLGYTRGTVASQKCYVDSAEAWSVNEITINWNAPLVAISSYMSDVASSEALIPGLQDAGNGSVNPGTTTTTTKPDTSGEYVPGDANCDGVVNMSDAVLVMQAIANPDKYGENGSDATRITAQGKKNADVVGNDGMTNSDALSIQKYILKLISKLPEA